MATGVGRGLPLLHKYVIQPQDNLNVVMAKLRYRLCVQEVTKVIHRRSLGESISEACEDIREMSSHPMVEPLVLCGKGEHTVESPQLLSPDDSGYCGTMKSDDSGIVMDDSQMNFSGDQSDMMFSSTEVSPLEEDNCILNGITKSPGRRSSEHLPGFQEDEKICLTIVEKQVNTQVADFFHRDGTPEQIQESSVSTEEVPNSWEDLDSSTEEEDSEEETIEEVSEVMMAEDEAPQTPEIHQPQHTETVEQLTKQVALPDTEETVETKSWDDEAVEEEEISKEVQKVVEAEVERDERTEDTTEKFMEEAIEAAMEEAIEEATEEPLKEESQEQEQEEERVEFVKETESEAGLRCDDVQTALQILKTHYKLSDTSVRKFIITFSSWNVNQFTHPISKRCSWWDESYALPVENPEVEDLMEEIYTRQGEISDLVDQIMEEEKLKQDLARHFLTTQLQQEQQEQQPEAEVVQEELLAAEDDIVHTASSPLSSQGAPLKLEGVKEEIADEEQECEEKDSDNNKDIGDGEEGESGKNSKKKRKGNALQRFLHAVRKRMTRSRPPTVTEAGGENKERAKA